MSRRKAPSNKKYEWRPTPRSKISAVLNKIPEYPTAQAKPIHVVDTTWEAVENPQTYVELLFSSSHLRFPDDTLMFTIEYVIDREEEFLIKIFKFLGLSGLQASLDVYVDLLWFFYVTGAPLLFDSEIYPGARAYLFRLSGEKLLDLLGPQKYHGPPYRSALLFTALTGQLNFSDIRRQYIRAGRYYNFDLPEEIPPLTSQEISMVTEPLWLALTSYGSKVYRIYLYLLPKYHAEGWRRTEDLVVTPEMKTLELLGTMSCIDAILEYEVESGRVIRNYGVWQRMTPLILEYQRDFRGTEYLEQLEEQKLLLPELNALIAGYSVSDNVESLAHQVGMVFPPHVDSPGKRTNYFFTTLHEYQERRREDGLPRLSRDRFPPEPLTLAFYSDQTLLETYGRPDDWKDRNDLLARIVNAIHAQHPLEPYQVAHLFIMPENGFLFEELEDGGFEPTGEKITEGRTENLTLDDVFRLYELRGSSERLDEIHDNLRENLSDEEFAAYQVAHPNEFVPYLF